MYRKLKYLKHEGLFEVRGDLQCMSLSSLAEQVEVCFSDCVIFASRSCLLSCPFPVLYVLLVYFFWSPESVAIGDSSSDAMISAQSNEMAIAVIKMECLV